MSTQNVRGVPANANRSASPAPSKPVVRRETVRSEAFGDYATDILVDDIVLHCLGGRDGERITMHADDKFHSLRIILAFAEHRTPAAAMDRPEPSLTEVFSRWPEIRQAIGTARFAGFERDLTAAAVARFNTPGAA